MEAEAGEVVEAGTGVIAPAEVPAPRSARKLFGLKWLGRSRGFRGLGSPLRDVRSAALLVGLLAALVYANSLGNRFAYDDVAIVEQNPTIQSLERLGPAVISSYWPGSNGSHMALWRPVTTAALGLQYIFAGGHPVVFHVVNVAGHVIASGLLVLLLAYLAPVTVAFVAGTIFAVHPVHTEAVANVVGVAELISAVAILGACLVHVRGAGHTPWGRALIIGVLYAIGFGAKESAVTLPGLIFLLDAARERLRLQDLVPYMTRRWRLYFVMLAVAAGLLLARLEILGSIASPVGPLGGDILSEIPRIWTLGEVWTHYVRLWVFPLDLSADYSPNVIPISFGWNATNTAGVVLALAVLVAGLVGWRRPELRAGRETSRIATFGLLWFVIAISPVSNTIFVSGVLLAERTLYLPSAGLAAATGWLIVRAARHRRRATLALLSIALVAASVRTWVRNPDWRDNNAVFATLLRDYPYSGRSQWMLGDLFYERGQISEALFAYRAAVNLSDNHYGLITTVAMKLVALERWKAAEGLLDHAWRDEPTAPLALAMRAGVRAEQGDAAGAERYARASLALEEHDTIRQHVLAWALASRGAWSAAVEARRKADQLGDVRLWHVWVYDAYLHAREGRRERAHEALDSAVAAVTSEAGRRALDRIRVEQFGLASLDGPEAAGPGTVAGVATSAPR